MSVVYLAEFQVRLLLCSPCARERDVLRWPCGCSAIHCGDARYAVKPCEYHVPLLREIPEAQNELYEAPARSLQPTMSVTLFSDAR